MDDLRDTSGLVGGIGGNPGWDDFLRLHVFPVHLRKQHIRTIEGQSSEKTGNVRGERGERRELTSFSQSHVDT